MYVEDFTLINEFYEKQFIEMDGDALAVPDYYDVLKPMYDDVQIVGRYQTGDHAGRPAVTQPDGQLSRRDMSKPDGCGIMVRPCPSRLPFG